jgi:hypothetical protein
LFLVFLTADDGFLSKNKSFRTNINRLRPALGIGLVQNLAVALALTSI